MKISELRSGLRTAGEFDSWSLSSISARELVADIDAALQKKLVADIDFGPRISALERAFVELDYAVTSRLEAKVAALEAGYLGLANRVGMGGLK